MRHIQILLCLIAWLLAATGCSSDKETAQTLLTVNNQELFFDPSGGEQNILLSSNQKWNISGNTDWCQATPATGNAGEKQSVTITVQANNSEEERNATLTLTSGNKNIDIKILQYRMVESSYADLGFENDAQLTRYDENTGEVVVTYTQNTPKALSEGQAIILPLQQEREIRIVRSSTVSGKTLTLQTAKGNMSNLFKDLEFTLTTNPALNTSTRSGKGCRVITPSEINLITAQGYQKIYDRQLPSTRLEGEMAYKIFELNKDFAKEEESTLYEGAAGTLNWETCNYDIGLDGVFHFTFGKGGVTIGKYTTGKLEEFSYYLDGNVNADFLLKYSLEKNIEINENSSIFPKAIAGMEFKFMAGQIPVYIRVNVDINKMIALDASASINAEAGFSYNANAHLGLEWTEAGGVQPIKSFKDNLTLHEPTYKAEGELSAKISLYPQMDILLYNFVGPQMSIVPYIEESLKAGIRGSMSGKDNYIGWKEQLQVGTDLELALNLNFGLSDEQIAEIEPIELFKKELYKAPHEIYMASPQDGHDIAQDENVEIQLEPDTETEVKFHVTAYSDLTPEKKYHCVNALVNLSSKSGNIPQNTYSIADKDGIVTIKWKPQGHDDELTAKVMDQDGETICQYVFIPVIEERRIELLSPTDQSNVENGQSVEVKFKVTSRYSATEEFTPKEGANVLFSDGDMKEAQSATSDDKGIVSIEWTPKTPGSKLKASLDVSGKTNATFTPILIESKIELLSPDLTQVLRIFEKTTVKFRFSYTNLDTGKQLNYPAGTIVKLQNTEGTLDSESHEVENAGTMTADWTPESKTSKLNVILTDNKDNVLKDMDYSPVIAAPVIERTDPAENNIEIENGEIINVTFYVKMDKGKGAAPLPGEKLTINGTGAISATEIVTDDKGCVTVNWTPDSNGAQLTAVLKAPNGKTAAEAQPLIAYFKGGEKQAWIGVWGAGDINATKTGLVLNANNTCVLAGQPGTYTCNGTSLTLRDKESGDSKTFSLSKLTSNVLYINGITQDNDGIMRLMRMTDNGKNFNVEDNRDNPKALIGKWKNFTGDGTEWITFNADNTFNITETGNGKYSYDPKSKTVTLQLGREKIVATVMCANKDLILLNMADEEDGGRINMVYWAE